MKIYYYLKIQMSERYFGTSSFGKVRSLYKRETSVGFKDPKAAQVDPYLNVRDLKPGSAQTLKKYAKKMSLNICTQIQN